MEVLFQGTTQDSLVAVGRECTGQHGDVAETTFEGFIWKHVSYYCRDYSYEPLSIHTENVRHLILEVLSSNEWVKKLLPTLNHGMDFTTASTEIGIVVERFPQVINGLASWLGTGIDEDAYLRLQHLADGIEQPTMGVDLLLIFSLDDQDELDGNKVVGIFSVWEDKSRCGVHRELSSVLTKISAPVTSHEKTKEREKNTSKMCATVSLPSTCFFITPS